MKKLVCVTLILLQCLLLFSGCAGEPEPLRVCVDVTYTTDYGDYFEPIGEAMTRFLTQYENAGGSAENIVVECIPPSGAERKTEIDRIRVEIASGGGPDVFIVNCDAKSSFDRKDALFPFPEKSMSLDLFLPLDTYIDEDTQYTDWSKVNANVLAAGRDDEGQQIIPLSYTFPVAVYRKEEATHELSGTVTWEKMLNADNMALKAAAVWTDNTSKNEEGCPFIMSRDALPEYILGKLADYGAEELSFTEEELAQCFEDITDLANQYTAGAFDTVPLHYNEFAGTNFTDGETLIDVDGMEYDTRNGITMYDPMTMIPLYSKDGGVTASVTAYAAVNRNTNDPEAAYSLIDFLMSFEAQRTGGLYQYLFFSDTHSLPMHDDVLNGKENSIYVLNLNHPDNHNFEWYMPEENFEALRAAREQITQVQFRDVLYTQLDAAYQEYSGAVKYGNADPDEAIAEAYRNMQRVLRE